MNPNTETSEQIIKIETAENENDMIVYLHNSYNKVKTQGRTVVNEIFDLHEKIGQGSFWTVYLVKRNLRDDDGNIRDNNYYVFKEGKLSKTFGCCLNLIGPDEGSEEEEFRVGVKEYDILKHVCHKNIARLFECIMDGELDKIVFVMEYCDMGTLMKVNNSENGYVYNIKLINLILEKKLARPTIDENSNININFFEHNDILVPIAKILFKQLAEAIKYLHQKNIVHLDIKPENILLKSDDLNLKLTDFSIAKQMKSHDEIISSNQGTPVYVPIEIQEFREYNPFKVDIYTFGATMYVFLFNNFDFAGNKWKIPGDDKNGLKILEEKYPRLLSLLERTLSEDPEMRPDIEELVEDEFFKE